MASTTPQTFDPSYFLSDLMEGEQIQLGPPGGDESISLKELGSVEFNLWDGGPSVCHREHLATPCFYWGAVVDADSRGIWNGLKVESGDCIRYGYGAPQFGVIPSGALTLTVVASGSEAVSRGWEVKPNVLFTLPENRRQSLKELVKTCLATSGEGRAFREIEEVITEILAGGELRIANRSPVAPRFHHLVSEALNLLDQEDLTRSLRAERFAEKLGVSQTTLEKAFRSILGTTPYQFILMKRLHRVRRGLLLREARRGLITEVATAAGFDNLSRMSRMYREIFGETPKQTLETK